MKFTKIKNPYLSRAISFTYSDNYLVGITGAKATVLTKKLEYVTEATKLKHVYDGEISPDETRLLLPSCNNREVWIFSIKNAEYKKIVTEKDLIIDEGWASWSSNGETFYLLLSRYDPDTNSSTSIFRRYHLDGNYTDLFQTECHLKSIHYVKSVGKQLICGTEHSVMHSYHFLLWYDENTEEIKRIDLPGYDNWLHGITIDELKQELHIDRVYSKTVCDFEGNIKNILSEKEYDIAEMLNVPVPLKLSEKLKTIRVIKTDTISHRLYVGTSTGLFLIDSDNGNILAKVSIKCGVDTIKLLTSDIVMIDTLHGICFYSLE